MRGQRNHTTTFKWCRKLNLVDEYHAAVRLTVSMNDVAFYSMLDDMTIGKSLRMTPMICRDNRIQLPFGYLMYATNKHAILYVFASHGYWPRVCNQCDVMNASYGGTPCVYILRGEYCDARSVDWQGSQIDNDPQLPPNLEHSWYNYRFGSDPWIERAIYFCHNTDHEYDPQCKLCGYVIESITRVRAHDVAARRPYLITVISRHVHDTLAALICDYVEISALTVVTCDQLRPMIASDAFAPAKGKHVAIIDDVEVEIAVADTGRSLRVIMDDLQAVELLARGFCVPATGSEYAEKLSRDIMCGWSSIHKNITAGGR